MANRPGTKITVRGEQTREQILQAARKLFTERGYHYTSVYDLFDHAETTKGAFFHHWKTKEDLALSLVQQIGTYFEEKYLAILEQPGRGRERLETAINLLSDSTKQDLCYGRLFAVWCAELHDDEDKIGPAVHALKHRWIAFWKQLIQSAQSDGDLRSDIPAENLSFLVVSAISGVQLLCRGTIEEKLKVYEALRKTILT